MEAGLFMFSFFLAFLSISHKLLKKGRLPWAQCLPKKLLLVETDQALSSLPQSCLCFRELERETTNDSLATGNFDSHSFCSPAWLPMEFLKSQNAKRSTTTVSALIGPQGGAVFSRGASSVLWACVSFASLLAILKASRR